ncbi:MAG: 30S ribosomal protein S27e [Candidatus Nitrosoabyssus spongiisocia]|nr:MAG: 30S ribosomal protein S27e [Nitrosopumilaceae archaeon AB1(1)]
MKKNHILIPKPTSTFRKIECFECKEVQVVYSHISTEVICNSCGNLLASPTGSIAKIHGAKLDSAE